jgi:hypothetical protein
MNKIIQLLSCSPLTIVAACATSEYTGSTNPYEGNYEGTEILEGGSSVSKGSYSLKIYISASGRANTIDVDNISVFGEMEENRFRVVRGTPSMVFEGKVADDTITGIATQNTHAGDGTFSFTLRGK